VSLLNQLFRFGTLSKHFHYSHLFAKAHSEIPRRQSEQAKFHERELKLHLRSMVYSVFAAQFLQLDVRLFSFS